MLWLRANYLSVALGVCLGVAVGIIPTIVFIQRHPSPKVVSEHLPLLPSSLPTVMPSVTPLPTASILPTPSATPIVSPTPQVSPSPSPIPPKVLTIVVVNEKGREAVLSGTYQRLMEALNRFQPWATYKPYIQVKKVVNPGLDLGCEDVDSEFRNNRVVYCQGAETLRIVRDDIGEPADIVIVAFGEGNRSATQEKVIGTEAGISAAVLAHELGHALADLDDEYMYGTEDLYRGNVTSAKSPNCFKTESACQAAVKPYYIDAASALAVCYQGCGSNDWWRPSYDGLMHTISEYGIGYGPVQECVLAKELEKKIAAVSKTFQPSPAFCARDVH